MALSEIEKGPEYGVELLKDLPLGYASKDRLADVAGHRQAMPDRDELMLVRSVSRRTVAALEVLTYHYVKQQDEIHNLRSAIQRVVTGNGSVTDLKQALGEF